MSETIQIIFGVIGIILLPINAKSFSNAISTRSKLYYGVGVIQSFFLVLVTLIYPIMESALNNFTISISTYHPSTLEMIITNLILLGMIIGIVLIMSWTLKPIKEIA